MISRAERLEVAVRHRLHRARVPTGMNAGVSTAPCAVRQHAAARAAVGVGDAKAKARRRERPRIAVHNRSERRTAFACSCILASVREETSRRRHLRRTIGRARSVARLGRRRLQEPRPRALRAGPDPDREGRPLDARRTGRRRRARPPRSSSRRGRRRARRRGRAAKRIWSPIPATRRSLDRSSGAERRDDQRATRRHRPRPRRRASRCCTAPTARTAPCRACSSWPTCRMSAPACSRPRSGMDKAVMKLRVRRARPADRDYRGAASDVTGATSARHRRASIEHALGFPVFVKPANLGSSVGISKAKTRGGAARGDRARRRVRSQDRRRGGGAAGARDRVRRARQRRARGVGRRARSCRRASSTTTRRSISTTTRRLLIPAPLDEAQTSEVRRLAIEAFRPSTAPAWRASTSCWSATTGTLFVNEINTIPGFTTISMYAKLWEASGARLPALARSPDRARARAPRREAAAEDQRHVTRGAGARALRSWRRSWPLPPYPSRRAAQRARSARRHLRSHPRCPVRRGRGVQTARACGPAPPVACQLLDVTALWWRIQLDPESLRARCGVPAAWTPPSGGRAWTCGSRAARKPGSTWGRPTARACNGACCGSSGSPRRATASGSRRRSSRRLPWIPGCRMPASGSASTTTTRTSHRRRPSCCAGCCCCPEATGRRGCATCSRRAIAAR